MQIRVASSTDAHAIAQIHVSAWQTAYRGLVPDDYLDALSVSIRESNWTNSIKDGRPQILVADSGKGLSGWVAFDRCRDEDKPEHTGEIWAIYVLPAYLGQGIGRELWLRARAELTRLGYLYVTLW